MNDEIKEGKPMLPRPQPLPIGELVLAASESKELPAGITENSMPQDLGPLLMLPGVVVAPSTTPAQAKRRRGPKLRQADEEDRPGSKRRQRSPATLTHKCPDCAYAAPARIILNRHLRTHTGERPYKCDRCSYSAAEERTVHEHMRIHTGEKPFKCDRPNCSYARNHLVAHIRTHTGEKPFLCKFCSYASAAQGALELHLRSHTGEKPYKCTYPGCEYAAASKATLTGHMRKHSGEKPFKCPQCEYMTGHKSALDRHVKTQHKLARNSFSNLASAPEHVMELVVVEEPTPLPLPDPEHSMNHTEPQDPQPTSTIANSP